MKRSSQPLAAAFLAMLPWPGIDAATAQDGIQNGVEVVAGTASDSHGRVVVNIAAGTGNQQAAQTSIAVGDIASTTGLLRQRALSLSDGPDAPASVDVAQGAFTGNSGLLSVNISAGRLNQSANLSQLAVGKFVAMSDQLLEQSRASTEPSGGTGSAASATNDTVTLKDGAFADNSGLVQLNLIGGARNSSANIFQLSMSAGSNP